MLLDQNNSVVVITVYIMRTNQAIQACYETYSYHISALYSTLHTYVLYVTINAVLMIPMDGLPSYLSWLNALILQVFTGYPS